MKILITGGTGLLGKALIETANPDYEIVATSCKGNRSGSIGRIRHAAIDVRDREGYDLLFKEFKPDVVVHTAGIGSPDYAERHKRESWEINIGGTENIIANCERYGSKFIYISSNGIYGGNNAPYGENDETVPINFYGEIKLEGEKMAKNAKVPCAIARPILMYGWNNPFGRPNIVTFALSQLAKDELVFAYDDVYVTPLFSDNCAKALWKIVEEGKYEIFNIGGKDRMSIYELLCKVAKAFNFDAGRIMPVNQGYFNELVKRPKDTSFHTAKMRDVLGIRPLSVDEGLLLMKGSGR